MTMSHNYLFDAYRFIRQCLDEARPNLTDADADQHAKQHAAGRIEALCDLERFLTEHYDIKLPRRLRQQQQTDSICIPDE